MASLADATVASWIQTGGVLAFAVLVLVQLRELRPVLARVDKTLASLLERDRARDEREAAMDAARAATAPRGVPESFDDIDTAPIPRVGLKRARTNPHGHRIRARDGDD